MIGTAIQLQSLQDLPESVPETITRVGETALEGVELFDEDVTSPSAVAEALAEAELEPVGAHVPVSRLEGDLDAVIETYDTIGCERLVVPTLDSDSFTREGGAEAAADRLSRIGAELADHGFELLYHNHAFEFARDDDVPYDAFVEALDDDVGLELDTGLVTFGGADPVDVLSRYEDRIPMIHLTDAVPGREATKQVELGAGELDVEACMAMAREASVEWAIYEHGLTADPLDSLTHAATKLPTLATGLDGVTETNPLSSPD